MKITKYDIFDAIFYLCFIALFFFAASSLFSCTKNVVTEAQASKPVSAGLAWGDSHKEWDNYLLEATAKSGLKEVKTPCKILNKTSCMAQLISIMAKYESSFDTNAKYTEGFQDSNGKDVISRGLLQLSVESGNQQAYGCGVNEKSLHDPKTNLECAVKIVTYQANKSGSLINGERAGCSAYFSVCRKSSKSYGKIMKYMEAY